MQKASIKEVLNGSDDTKFVTPKTLSKYFSTKQTGGGGGSTADLSNYYNKQQTAALIDAKIDEIPEPDLSNYYNKQETDAKIDAIPKTDLSNYYNKTETEAVVTSMINAIPEPDLTDYYNKSETETLVDRKIGEIPDVDLSNYYNKSEVDALIENIPSSGGGDGVDTLPIGSIVEYDGDTVPDGYEEIDNSLNIITDGDAIKAGYKIDGKDVWVKRCTLGKLPNKTEIVYDVGITSSVAQIEDVKISAKGGWQQVMPSMHTQVLLGPNGLAVATGANISDFYAIATLYFTYL